MFSKKSALPAPVRPTPAEVAEYLKVARDSGAMAVSLVMDGVTVAATFAPDVTESAALGPPGGWKTSMSNQLDHLDNVDQIAPGGFVSQVRNEAP